MIDRGHGLCRRHHRTVARLAGLAVALCALLPEAIAAQEFSLIDKLSVGIGGGWSGIDTRARLDSKKLGIGTEINFEDDLDASQINPDVRVEWRLKNRHVLRLFYNDNDRTSLKEGSKDLQFGDLVIPVGASVETQFDIETITLGYTYFFVLKERLGFGINAGICVLDVSIGDISGSQLILTVRFEHLFAESFSWGLEEGVSSVDVELDDPDFLGTADIDLDRFGLFVKWRT